MTHVELASPRSRMPGRSRGIRRTRPLMEFTYRRSASYSRRETVSVDYQRVANAFAERYGVNADDKARRAARDELRSRGLSSVEQWVESVPREHDRRRLVTAASPPFARFYRTRELKITNEETRRNVESCYERHPDSSVIRDLLPFRSPESCFFLIIRWSSEARGISSVPPTVEEAKKSNIRRNNEKRNERISSALDAIYSPRLSISLSLRSDALRNWAYGCCLKLICESSHAKLQRTCNSITRLQKAILDKKFPTLQSISRIRCRRSIQCGSAHSLSRIEFSRAFESPAIRIRVITNDKMSLVVQYTLDICIYKWCRCKTSLRINGRKTTNCVICLAYATQHSDVQAKKEKECPKERYCVALNRMSYRYMLRSLRRI